MAGHVDILLINPGDRRQVYQDLGSDLAAIEPPFWIAAIAAYIRNNGFSVAILDANAESISPEEIAAKINDLKPLLTAVIVYGSQPSASTQNMTIAGKICRTLKNNTSTKVAIGGLHASALPKRTMEEEEVDFVIEGEGPYTLVSLLNALKSGTEGYSEIPGLWYRKAEGIKANPRAPLIKDLDEVLPLAAWDLLPMHKYRAHNWHCFDDIDKRSPYAAIYTSLGCPYNCLFCCINTPFGKPGIRFRSPELVIKEIDYLVENFGIRNIKIIDELFILNERHYMTIVNLLKERDYDLNIWAYARVDTIKKATLEALKEAGIRWFALGIETADPDVRDGASKNMKLKDIRDVVQSIHNAGISIIGNFIFGLPDDTFGTMQQTLDMAIDLNCEYVNFYCAMAYPGSRLYDIALENGWELPAEWHAFSQHSYEMIPLPTKYVSAKDVLKFRDDAFHKYFEGKNYLDMIEKRFGTPVKRHIQEMTRTRLKREALNLTR